MQAEPIVTVILSLSFNCRHFPEKQVCLLLYVITRPIVPSGILLEHRLFSQVHKAMEGVVFSDYQTVQKCIEQTSTKTGLTVVVRLNLKEYQTGIKIDKSNLDQSRITYHSHLPELNYRIYP
jgi:Rhodopirellula transposase DDE domain